MRTVFARGFFVSGREGTDDGTVVPPAEARAITAACWTDAFPFLAPGQPGVEPADARDRFWMEEALALARRRLGATWPNPTVGAVVVNGGRIVGRGFHRQAGAPHAEVMALQQAGEQARGATLYVTLEPCSHQGRTPPCTDAVIAAGVERVVAALPDPHPRVRGRGLKRLLEAGVTVSVGTGAAEAFALNEPFFCLATRGRPWVTFKCALSLDGKIAPASGDARWITGPAARRRVHRLRRRLPAVMVGVGTVLADDPALTARDDHDRPVGPQPLRIVVDTDARTPPTARLLSQPGTTLIVCGAGAPADRLRALEAAGAQVAVVPRGPDQRISLPALMEHLAQRQVVGVLLEGGGTLAGAMVAAGLVDEVIFHVAPLLIGGDAPGPLRGPGAWRMEDAWRLREWTWHEVDGDLELRGTLGAPAAERCRSYYAAAATLEE